MKTADKLIDELQRDQLVATINRWADQLAAGERLADAVGVLVEDSMERNGPQVPQDIVDTYREFRATQEREA